MELIQRGFSCAYEMEIFIKIFFGANEKGIILTDLCHESDIINVYVEIIFDGKSYIKDLKFPFPSDETDKKIIKKNYTCSVTKAFLETAKEI